MPKNIITVPDPTGNLLFIEQHPDERYGHLCTLYVQLTTERKKRLIGTLDKNLRVFYTVRAKGKHLLRKLNAYGFNYSILSRATHFDEIHLTDEEGVYVVPRTAALEQGKFLHFRDAQDSNSYEKQIFLPLEVLQSYKQ